MQIFLVFKYRAKLLYTDERMRLMISYKIAVIGCGKVGGPTADLLEKNGHEVTRFDIAFNTGWTLEQSLKDRDLIFIAVPTPHKNEYDGSAPSSHLPSRDFSYNSLNSSVRVCAALSNAPIAIISTVLPGTMRKIFDDLKDRVIYNPYLISMGAVTEDLQDPEMVILGSHDGKKSLATKMLKNIYQGMTNYKPFVYNISTWEEAESIKIFYNTFISAKLGIVNMIQDVAMKIGNMNVDVVTDALTNSTKRIISKKYMTAGMGDGGPCHPRDNIALRWMAEELDLGYDLFNAVMTAREQQANNMAKYLVKLSRERNVPIYINGKAFKPGISLTDGSYSLLVAHYVAQQGESVRWIDPLTEEYNPPRVWGVILLAHNAAVTYGKDAKLAVYAEIIEGSIVVDPWRTYTTDVKGVEVIHYGNTRSTT